MKKTKNGTTTIAFNGDYVQMLEGVQMMIPKYEYLDMSDFVRLMVLEGLNKVHGATIKTNYVKAMQDLKKEQREARG